ncbi:MAG: WbqC family protein [Bacteroidota bacterium]
MKVVPICYYPPVHWYASVIREEAVHLEVSQHYRKQQFTSRCHIKVANRILPLTIPVGKRGAKVPIRDKKISYEVDWQTQHWRSIYSAYRNSPFFEYYEDDVKGALFTTGLDLTHYLLLQMEGINRMLGMDTRFVLTSEYLEEENYGTDLRKAFDPSLKRMPTWFTPRAYPQVFGDFVGGLSILDLLFNMGPESRAYLMETGISI